jgi:glutaredoxin-related protein
MVLLVYSQNCSYSAKIIEYIRSQQVLLNIVRFHNINTSGVPNGLTRVPAIITKDGATIIGGDVKTYLENLIPNNIESTNIVGGKLSTYSLDGSSGDMRGISNFDSFGHSLSPPMTKELEEKIGRNVQDAYQTMNSSS